jgi:DNA-directed RNA polymerase subunit K/omega
MADISEETSIGPISDELDTMPDDDIKSSKKPLEEDTDTKEADEDDDEEDEEGEEDGDGEDGEEGEEDDEIKSEKAPTVRKSKKKPIVTEDDEDDDDDEDELPSDVMGRLDYLQTHHPEVIFPDSAEMQAILASYTREEEPVPRKSRPILSKYEATSVVGMRSQQIVQGSAPLVDVPTDDPIEIAQAELKAKIIPVVIRRILPNGSPEYWRLSELRYYG